MKSSKPNALIILTPGFPENESDTSCLPERQSFVRSLKRIDPNLKLIVISFQYPFRKRYYKWNGLDVYAFGGRNKSKLNRAILWMHIWQRLKQLNRKNHITGILSFWLGECAFVGNAFARRYHLKHYCWLLGQDTRPGNKYVDYIKPKAESLIALSDFLANEFFKNYLILPKHIVPTGIDPDNFDDPPEKRTYDICGAGSLIPLKRYDLFITVIKDVAIHFPNLKVALCGKGPEKEKLEQYIEQSGLSKIIELKGEIPHKELLNLMQRTKIFVHTSEFEGFATVLSEALYAGAHVVSFCKPMESEIEQLYIAENVKDMVRIVINLLKEVPENKSILPYNVRESALYIYKLLFAHQGIANTVQI